MNIKTINNAKLLDFLLICLSTCSTGSCFPNKQIRIFLETDFLFLISGFRYMNPDTSNISDYCSEINNTSSCGLLVREQESEVRCRFDSCDERHIYACKEILTLFKDDPVTSIPEEAEGWKSLL